jgi:hypothetical protein
MQPEGRVVVNDTRRGFFVGWREIFLLFLLMIFGYFAIRHLAERGYDLSKIFYPTMIVVGNNVNLRTGPSVYYPTINRLPRGSRVIYLNEYREVRGVIWAKVRGFGNDGWVNRYYLN